MECEREGGDDRKARLLVVGAVFSIVCALTKAEVAARVITVTPARPTISVGQRPQVTASGTTTATAAKAGAFHTCALLQDGAIGCRGAHALCPPGGGTTA